MPGPIATPDEHTLEHTPAGIQLTVMGLVGVVCGGLVGVLTSPALGPLVGWDTAALAWLTLIWRRLWRLDAAATARLALHKDPNRAAPGRLPGQDPGVCCWLPRVHFGPATRTSRIWRSSSGLAK
ncbi:hypothetical protein ACNAW0_15975 [Micromonospora sp. SL1-18]|uniref:hypothetical protein n=1 Tax=Micromonospora sp. SL1-18 TaxID=3399128 RepID=UPI003A4DC0DB